MLQSPSPVADWISRQLRSDAPRAPSLIITIFGDSVAPYVDGIWLGGLIGLMASFGANERLVRTSVFRLTEQGWLVATREGRRSFYRLGASGRRRFRRAYDRVYKVPVEWDGSWTWVVLPKTDEGIAYRAELRKELEWEGYGALGSNVFFRPTADEAALAETLAELNLVGKAMLFKAQELPLSGRAAEHVVSQCWDLQPISTSYQAFLARFKPVHSLIEANASMTPEQGFVVQSLLIDAFRRVTIRDPRLPIALLPDKWPGREAAVICTQIYRRTHRLAREHLLPLFQGETKSVPKLPAEIEARFGGLK